MNNKKCCKNCKYHHYSGPCHDRETPFCTILGNGYYFEVSINGVCDKYECDREEVEKEIEFKKENNYRMV